MELKLTTSRAIAFEERTGVDLIAYITKVAKDNTIELKYVVELFKSMGDGYTADMFDEWEGTFLEKATAILNAVNDYVQGKK